MKILITGAFGFVGTNLSAYLAERGYEVWALDVVDASRQDAKTQGMGNVSGEPLAVNRESLTVNGKPLTVSGEPLAVNGKPLAVSGETCREADGKERLTAYGSRLTGSSPYTRCFTWEELDRIPWGEVDAVVHLAGKAHDTRNTSDAKSYFDINVGLTKKIVDAWMSGNSHREEIQSATGKGQGAIGGDVTNERMNARTKALRKFIFFSSVKAVADRVEGVLTEEAVPDPKTPYGQSKMEAERVVRVVSGKSELGGGSVLSEMKPWNSGTSGSAAIEPLNQAAGRLNYYILRPCMIHGPGNKGNLNLLYGVVKKGIPWPLGAFENKRSFTSIGNVCEVIEALLKGDIASGVYQMADDEALSTNDLIGLIAESLGKRIRIWRIPAKWIRAVARMGDALKLPLNSERLKKLTESYVASNVKIKNALGWERMPVRARDGMRKTLESFRQ